MIGYAQHLASIAPQHKGVRVFGPTGTIPVGNNRYRVRFFVGSATDNIDLPAYLREWVAAAPKKHASIKVDFDVDPQSFLVRE